MMRVEMSLGMFQQSYQEMMRPEIRRWENGTNSKDTYIRGLMRHRHDLDIGSPGKGVVRDDSQICSLDTKWMVLPFSRTGYFFGRNKMNLVRDVH